MHKKTLAGQQVCRTGCELGLADEQRERMERGRAWV